MRVLWGGDQRGEGRSTACRPRFACPTLNSISAAKVGAAVHCSSTAPLYGQPREKVIAEERVAMIEVAAGSPKKYLHLPNKRLL